MTSIKVTCAVKHQVSCVSRATGPAGVGVPVGGTTGQVLAKKSNTDRDTEWVDQTGGTGPSSGSAFFAGNITTSNDFIPLEEREVGAIYYVVDLVHDQYTDMDFMAQSIILWRSYQTEFGTNYTWILLNSPKYSSLLAPASGNDCEDTANLGIIFFVNDTWLQIHYDDVYNAEEDYTYQVQNDIGWICTKDKAGEAEWVRIDQLGGTGSGNTILSGTIDPTTEGSNGDYYINTTSWKIFGPKAAGAWSSGVSIIGATGAKGDKGDTGSAGTNGTNGTDGNTVLYGTVDPTTEGVNGNFYINTTSWKIFGPKAGGVWPAGVSIIGAAGAKGDKGDTGATGAAGPSSYVLGFSVDGGGSPVPATTSRTIVAPYNGTIQSFSSSGGPSGTFVVDVKRGGVSIVGSGNKPTITSNTSATAAVSGWTSTTVAVGDVIEFVVDTMTTMTWGSAQLLLART